MGEQGYSAGNLTFSISSLGSEALTSLKNINEELKRISNKITTITSSLAKLGTGLQALSNTDISVVKNKLSELVTVLEGLSGSASNIVGITSALGKLGSLGNSLSKISKTDISVVVNNLTKLVTVLESLSGSESNIAQISTVLGSLGKLGTSLGKIANLDMEAFKKNMEGIISSLTPFIAKVNEGEKSLTALASVLREINVISNKGGTKGSSKGGIAKNLNFLASINKIYFAVTYTRRLAQGVGNLIKLGIDYNETLNLWQVAMRGNVDIANEFITKMNKAYGVSRDVLMNYQAIFKNMLGSLGGIDENVSYQLSEFLTQMALDFSSLYNTSIEKAMTTFQQVLSGQVRPVRSIAGYDITENTIYEMYQQLGGEKSLRQLSQTEKRLLRVYAVMQQMQASGAMGDLSKTIENSANQARILSNVFREWGMWVGRILELVVGPLLQGLNAVFILIRDITKAIARANGVVEENFLTSGFEEANEQLDDLQGKLLSFDKFEALNSSGDKDSGLGIDQALLDKLSEYNSLLDDTKFKAQELASEWGKFWFVDGDAENGLTSVAKELLTVLESIGIALGVILAKKIVTWAIESATAVGWLSTAFGLLSFTMLTGAVYAFIKMIEAFEKGETGIGIIAGLIGITLVGAYIALEIARKRAALMAQFHKATTFAEKKEIVKSLNAIKLSYLSLAIGVGVALASFALFSGIINSIEGPAKQTVSIIATIVGALAALILTVLTLKGVLKGGLAGALIGLSVGVALAGIVGLTTKNAEKAVIDNTSQYTPTSNVGQMSTNLVGISSNLTSGYSAPQTNSVGNVYIDGKTAGKIISQPSYGEQKRVGLVK